MKLYKLRFTENDFVSKDSATWRTDIVDLYNNDQYVNYSAFKAPYGTDLLSNGVYTGLNTFDSVNTEIGFVDSGRFVDTSGLINMIEWKVSVEQTAQADINCFLNVYTTDDGNLTPYYSYASPSLVSDWTLRSGIAPGDPIYELSSNRYAFFEIVFDSDAAIDPSADVELIISVEITSPVVNGFFDGTRRVLDKFPEWMEMREYDPEDVNDENKATPETVGGSFINAMSGEWLTELRNVITYSEFQRFIENVDLDQIAWVYRSLDLPEDLLSITYLDGSDTQLTYAADLAEFYNSNSDEHLIFYNRRSKELFSRQKYPEGEFKVNGVAVEQQPYQVWNALDEIGLTVDLFRLHLENNISFQKRILDVFINQPGVDRESFKLSVRRELDLWRYSGATPATPDSFALGSTPNVLDMEDIVNSSNYFDAEGNATSDFFDLVSRIAKRYPTTWGEFEYEKALWDTDGLGHKGYGVIPKKYDSEAPALNQYQSGVGDINDLKLLPPDFYQPDREFDVTLAVRGREPTPVSQYTSTNLRVRVTGYATRTVASYESDPYQFHIFLDRTDGPESIANFSVSSNYYGGDPGDIDLADYTPAGTWPPPNVTGGALPTFDWLAPNLTTNSSLVWYDANNGDPLDGPIELENVTSIAVRPGYFDPDTGFINSVPDTDYYRMSFADTATPSSNLGYGGLTSITAPSTDPTLYDLKLKYEIWEFNATEDDTEGFVSTPQEFDITLNAGDTLGSTVLTVSNFEWPTYNGDSSEVHKIKVEILGQDENGLYGGFTRNGLFIEADGNISLEANSTWSTNSREITLGSPLTPGQSVDLTFALTSATGYPETVNTWSTFKATQVSPLTNCKVGKNGPWRDGQPPIYGNMDRVLDTLFLDRSDFGIGEDAIITWIGVDSISDPDVLVWLDSNSVVPVGEDASSYPDGAFLEYETATPNKYLGPVNVYAKLSSELNPKWYPWLHSGWYYEDGVENYVYASPTTATASTPGFSLGENPYLGAPIHVVTEAGTPVRQVPFSTADHTITEQVYGNGTEYLYLAYDDVSDVAVVNLSTDTTVTLDTDSATNKVEVSETTSKDHLYEITYKPDFAFHAISSTPGFTELVFSHAPIGGDNYVVTWETSKYNPATPISVPLHPSYAGSDEGFVFIDNDSQDFTYSELYISNNVMLATPGEYAMGTITSLDSNGNPKPGIEYVITATSDVTITPSTVTTDEDGKAVFYIDAKETSTSGLLFATPNVSGATPMATAGYTFESADSSGYSIKAVMDSSQIMADGLTGNTLFGIVLDPNDSPVANATVFWRKARDLEALFDISRSNSLATPDSDNDSGMVFADSSGRFVIGNFISHEIPGYWLVSVESSSISPTNDPNTETFTRVGDITYWYEYLGITNILDPSTMQPIYSVQAATPPYLYPSLYSTPNYPVTYDEEDYYATPNSIAPDWTPPDWYPIADYDRYQTGL